MAEASAGPRSRASLLSLLPGNCCEIIWDALCVKDRHNLVAASKEAQEVFAPAVYSISCKVYEDELATSQKPFRGLHPAVQPKYLRISRHHLQPEDASTDSTDGEQNSMQACLMAVASSPHLSQLRSLDASQVDMPPAVTITLLPLFQLRTLVDLELNGCDLHLGSLTYIAACTHLQLLVLDRVSLVPCHTSGDPPAPSAGLPKPRLYLAMYDIRASTGIEDQPMQVAAVVQVLGKHLVRLRYSSDARTDTGAAQQEVMQLLKVAHEGHLPGVQHLTYDCRNTGLGWSIPEEEYVRSLPDQCPMLQILQMCNLMLPDVQLTARLMAMPSMHTLQVFSALPFLSTPPPVPVTADWPAGKARMQLVFNWVPISLLSTLPLEHVEKLTCGALDMDAAAGSTAAQQCSIISQALDLLRSRGVVLATNCVSGTMRNGAIIPPSGLSALPGPSRHLQVAQPFTLCNQMLDAADMTAVTATWGSKVEALQLKVARVTPAAWAAITASAFPRLKHLTFSDLVICEYLHLAALCMAWPQERKLRVTIQCPYQAADLRSGIPRACQDGMSGCLSAHGKGNVEIIAEWGEEPLLQA